MSKEPIKFPVVLVDASEEISSLGKAAWGLYEQRMKLRLNREGLEEQIERSMDERDDITDEVIQEVWKDIEKAVGFQFIRVQLPPVIEEAWQPMKQITMVDR